MAITDDPKAQAELEAKNNQKKMKQQRAFCKVFMTNVEPGMYNGGKKLKPSLMGQMKTIHKKAGELRGQISAYVDGNKVLQQQDLDGMQVALRVLKDEFNSIKSPSGS